MGMVLYDKVFIFFMNLKKKSAYCGTFVFN